MNVPVVYLKLGGSLITDKRRPETPRLEVLQRLAQEIRAAWTAHPEMRLVLGHGSGSFGHVAARRYGTRQGVHTSEEWYGFAVTGDAAARLNRQVTAALLAVRLPVWSIQPGAAALCQDGRLIRGPEETVREALARGLIPLIYGDVVLDTVRGGTIASTEELFERLAEHIPPTRLILAGEVPGVFTADPQRSPDARHLPRITPSTYRALRAGMGPSAGVDVTGGMASKVEQALRMVQRHPGLRILLCDGRTPGVVEQALRGEVEVEGTWIEADPPHGV